MKFIPTEIPEVLVIEPKVLLDERGYFFEGYKRDNFFKNGIRQEFIQDNYSKSVKNTLRGLHYQLNPYSQAKLVQIIAGEVFDVAVDIRKGSPTFGKWVGRILSSENKKMLFIPEGFAHGFYVLSETAEFHYKCSNIYNPENERTIKWDDNAIKIAWPIPNNETPLLSNKDKAGLLFKNAEINFTY